LELGQLLDANSPVARGNLQFLAAA